MIPSIPKQPRSSPGPSECVGALAFGSGACRYRSERARSREETLPRRQPLSWLGGSSGIKLCGLSSCHFLKYRMPSFSQRIGCIELLTNFFHEVFSLEILHKGIYRLWRESQYIRDVPGP